MHDDTQLSQGLDHPTSLERCHTYLLLQLRRRSLDQGVPSELPGPAITLSYQAGSAVHEIAQELAQILQETQPKGAVPWTVFDRNLVEIMLEEHHLPHSLVSFISEDRRSMLQDTIDELLGSRIPSWDVVPKLAETVLHLAHAGHAILVGRGANVITADLPNTLHVRLIASMAHRVEYCQTEDHLSPTEAAERVRREDRAAGRYIKTHFHVAVEDDSLYHLTLNTDRMPPPDAAWLIAEAARKLLRT